MTATIFYQATSFSQHPNYSLQWILGLTSVFIFVLIGLWWVGRFLQVNDKINVISNDSI